MHSPILAPLVALVLWSFVMWGWLYATRLPAMMRNRIVYDPHRPAEEFHAALPAQVRWKAAADPVLCGARPGVRRRRRRPQHRARLALCGPEDRPQPRPGDPQPHPAALRHLHGRIVLLAMAVRAAIVVF